MASVAADANISGSASASAPAQVLFTTGPVLFEGQSSGQGDITGSFNGGAALQADSEVGAPGDLTLTVTSAPVAGDADMGVGEPLYLLYSDVAGQAITVAAGEVAVEGLSDVSGDAETTAGALLVLGGVAAAAGDAEVTPDADMALAAASGVSGDATVSFTALADDEIASDAYGTADAALSTTMVYAAAAAIVGGASINPHAIVRPAGLAPRPPVEEVEDGRLVGYQPGRPPHARREQLSVLTDPDKLRQQNRDVEDETSTTPNRVRSTS